MFLIKSRANRQPSCDGLYFLYFFFILHICTAFLTIISALNSDLKDNEAIIQLSMDSIHVVESSDHQIVNIEENINDNEEKELLTALLTSYDDEIETIKKIDNEIPIITTSTSIRFIPSLLNFAEQSIAIPQMQTVIIINDDTEPLELYSLTATTNQFYSSFFKQIILSSYGDKTSINIYYLPRTIGIINSIFTIKTNRGNFYYNVSGIGKLNPFRLRPLINANIPLNSTYEYTIQFYNPYNYSLDINEIYTSDENLIIEFLTKRNMKNRITKTFEYYEQWRLKPYEIKSIIKINYFAYKLNKLHAYICIKTNFSDIIIIPVEINVLNRSGLYSNVDLLEFTNHRFILSSNKPITIPVYVFNNGLNPMIITDVRVTPEHKNYITIHFKNLPIPSDIHRLNQIADVTIHPNLISNNIHYINGYIQVYSLSNNEEFVLEIPFHETILHGSLHYKKEDTFFYISSSNHESVNDNIKQCQSIKLLNQYNIPISVYNITVNKLELLSQFVKIEHRLSFFYLYPEQWSELLCITHLKQSLSSVPFTNIQTSIDIHTNISNFIIPIYLYNGFLSVNLLTDHTNGGIRQYEKNPYELFITSIPMNTSRKVTFVLTNTNPIDIEIKKFYSTLSKNIDIELDYMTLLNGNKTKIINKNINISQMVIPEQHQAIFSLTINGTKLPKFYNESITFETNYQTLKLDVNYQIINGSLEFMNKTPIHIDVFPNRLGTADIYLQNKFDESINITRIDFITYGICFSFTWKNTSIGHVELQSNKIQQIGTLNFDMTPLCKNIHTLSESTCYCGLSHHREFKQRWDEHISALNTYELDHILVNQFRNLWNEWTTLVQQQQVQTNIWLYTDRANISWPVTIGFVWPSVLEYMSSSLSRTPMILDFDVIYINITKTQNIIITNPSSDLVTYSVELLNSYPNNSKSMINDQVFTISTTSKEIKLINDIYNFNLLPNEHITFTISFQPILLIKYEMYLIIRNNLTIIESILLRGEGGIGSLQVGNRPAGSSLIPIVLKIDEKQYELCSMDNNENPLLRKLITLHNIGNMKTIIYDISFGNSKCFGQGFSVSICTNIEIESNKKYDLKILFQPDYTSDEINETLILNTNIGLMTFPIIVQIPQRVLLSCYKTIPRPSWELRTYGLCFCSFFLFIILIFTTAIYEARRLFDNYLSRAEWRDRMQMTDNKIFDLSDLSLAVQDEQKTRERLESNPITDMKKEKNESKRKRSNASNHENEDKSLKSIQNSDGLNTNIRSVIDVNSKSISHKQRRATTYSDSLKFSKCQNETSSKKQSLQRRKSDQHTSKDSRKITSSTTVSEEEIEPFIIARSKRTSNKVKESSNNTTSPSIIDNTIATKQKPSVDSHQQDLLQLDDNINDQRWHRVSSNKGQRKGNTIRREITDETQATNKPIKVSSTNSENSRRLSSSSSSHKHSSISHEISQSHYHPSQHCSTRNSSSIPVPIETEKKSLQDDISLISTNRESTLRQLAEQLWASRLSSSTTVCSMSIRSRCSSAPASEHGGAQNETIKIDQNNDEKEDKIDWDEPDVPDEGNSSCFYPYYLVINNTCFGV
ncbi:unnamed protein product [Rotaria sp. Silwood1]|nr:unnamed protein product [Rotaria sp. Silwood1]CAF1562868.1 unnamed protein product [Rotaria sp. Silwood1]